jgi:hypothetical protein|nr:MAG TPA: minor capsid protein [Caudoviricetes sp.]
MTPEELEKLPKPLERTMTALELSIMDEIIQRIKEAAQITPVIDWLLIRMDAIGTSRIRIKQLIGKALEKTDLQVDDIYEQAARSDYIRNKEIYEAAGRDYLPYKDNQWLQQVVDAAKRQTKDTLRPLENIAQTTGFNVPMGGGKKVFTPLSEYLERSLDKAILGITTGTKTYSQAIGDVIDEMTASGIRTVDYASGKSDRIEVAARRAVMTGVAQMTKQVSDKNAEELGTDYWEVDWHMGARNTGTGYLNHQSWQGRVYSSEEMRTVCGEGEMLGFAGINCYHIKFPFLLGISKRKYTDEWLAEQNKRENEKKVYRGREYDTYGALQHQRKLERTIRKQKQDVELLESGEADKEDIMAAKCRLRLTNKTYVDFSKEMGLRQQRERLRIPKEIPKAKLGAGSLEGDAPGKPELLGQIDPRDTDRAVEYYNEQIRNEDVEHSFVIDRKGNVYYSVGDETSVSLEGIDLKGATVTHNHPESEGIVSFGKNDFEFLRAYQDIRELQCVNSKYSYKVSVVKDITEVVYNDIYLAGFKYAMEPDYESQDAAMRILRERGYIKYERVRFEPGEEKEI